MLGARPLNHLVLGLRGSAPGQASLCPSFLPPSSGVCIPLGFAYCPPVASPWCRESIGLAVKLSSLAHFLQKPSHLGWG